jgi:hypothetical protein
MDWVSYNPMGASLAPWKEHKMAAFSWLNFGLLGLRSVSSIDLTVLKTSTILPIPPWSHKFLPNPLLLAVLDGTHCELQCVGSDELIKALPTWGENMDKLSTLDFWLHSAVVKMMAIQC